MGAYEVYNYEKTTDKETGKEEIKEDGIWQNQNKRSEEQDLPVESEISVGAIIGFSHKEKGVLKFEGARREPSGPFKTGQETSITSPIAELQESRNSDTGTSDVNAGFKIAFVVGLEGSFSVMKSNKNVQRPKQSVRWKVRQRELSKRKRSL